MIEVKGSCDKCDKIIDDCQYIFCNDCYNFLLKENKELKEKIKILEEKKENKK